MKLSSLLLTGSLAANAALAALFFAGASRRDSSTTPTSLPSTAAAVMATATGEQAAADPETWARLQTADLPAYLARLQAEGFPLKIAQALAGEGVRMQFAPRRAALNLKENERPFWEPATQDPKTAAALREIMKEQTQALKNLLGADAMENENYATSLRRQFPGLAGEKIDQLQRIQQGFNEQRSELYANFAGGTMLLADREKITALDKAQHAEIAKALTPEELELYDLRTSSTASSLRYQLSAFDTTEQEFRTLYQLRNAFGERLGPMYAPPSPDESRARAEAQKELNEQIKAALGDQRYVEYQRATDYNYQTTSRLVARLELPAESTNQVWAVQQDIQQRLRDLQANRLLTPDDRNQQLTALADEAKSKVTATLGDRGYEAYKQYGGSWMQALQARPAPGAPGALPDGTIRPMIRL